VSQTGGYVHTEEMPEDGREGGQGPTRTVEPWSSSSSRHVDTMNVTLPPSSGDVSL